MQSLRLIPYLTHVQERNGAALSGKLECVCGGRYFEIYHTGKQTHGVLTPYLVRKNRQLAVRAVCAACGFAISLYDSNCDGKHCTPVQEPQPLHQFELPKEDRAYRVTMMYNYMPEDFVVNGLYSNEFSECVVELANAKGRTRRLVEECV